MFSFINMKYSYYIKNIIAFIRPRIISRRGEYCENVLVIKTCEILFKTDRLRQVHSDELVVFNVHKEIRVNTKKVIKMF